MSYEDLTLLVSLLAIVISTVSLVRARRLGEEQLKLEKITAELSAYQIKEIEERALLKDRPAIKVRLSKLGNRSEFVVANAGQGSAYDINFELVDCSDSPLYDAESKLPYPELRPSSTFKLGAAFHMGSPVQYQVKVTWRDSRGLQEDVFWVS
ncbi:hypothetical protein K1X80_19990 [Pseudomonas sp. So3.2b]|uniref:hypothetical protein n=1 Tax=Pseudomonas sp. So3.2b TaxID=2864101 RepID=UPI001C690D9D|nr:hypothetical protein [Pseudomonas sp. So3.2b]QYM67282.1 hypothetical protein K1X80_19990 [Pseudomonas sp. So3.2b]